MSALRRQFDGLLASVPIEHLPDIDAESVENRRCRTFVPLELAVLHVCLASELQHRDRLRFGIDDPILGDATFRVVMALLDEVAFRVVGADNLKDKVGTGPEAFSAARIMAITNQQ